MFVWYRSLLTFMFPVYRRIEANYLLLVIAARISIVNNTVSRYTCESVLTLRNRHARR